MFKVVLVHTINGWQVVAHYMGVVTRLDDKVLTHLSQVLVEVSL